MTTPESFTFILTTKSSAGDVKRHEVEVTQADLAERLSRGVRDWRTYAAAQLQELEDEEKLPDDGGLSC